MNIVQPSKVSGMLTVPPSKSAFQRYVVLAALTNGKTHIANRSDCADGEACLKAITSIGAEVSESPKGELEIRGFAHAVRDALSCGESGTALRILSAAAALFETKITLSGLGSLSTRPMEMIEQPLIALGAECRTTNGKLPLHIKGPLVGGEISIDGSLTSQFLSGLLIALPLAKRDSAVKVINLKSRPYVEMTLQAVTQFGGVINREGDTFFIAGNQIYKPQSVTVEGDWSSASFLLVAGAVAGSISVNGLRTNSTQADIAVITALRGAGAEVEISKNSSGDSVVRIEKQKLQAFRFDISDCPDLAPPLCALASNCEGTSEIIGVSRLIHKETDRAAALQKEFRALGISINIVGDSLMVQGGSIKGSVTVSSHNDHRIAMACAVAGLNSETPIQIDGSESVQKSYPDFFKDLARVSETKL